MRKDKAWVVERGISRRALLGGLGVAAALGPFVLRQTPAVAQQRFAGKTVRLLTWSDPTGKTTVENVAKPFEAETGAKVIADLTGSTSEMVAKVKASQAKPQYDVINLGATGAIALAKAGLLEKPDLTKIPNLAHVIPNLRTTADGFAIGYWMFTNGLMYNTKLISSPPDSWSVMWDNKYAGKLYLPPPSWGEALSTIIIAARLAGGSETNPEPGFKKLQELKGRVVTLTENTTQVAELFRSNSIAVGGSYSPTYLIEFMSNPQYGIGSALTSAKEGFFYEPQPLVIPKGHPGDSEVVYAFVNYALDAAVQAKAVPWGPVNQQVAQSAAAKANPAFISPEIVQKKGIAIGQDFLAKVRPEWTKRYTEIFG